MGSNIRFIRHPSSLNQTEDKEWKKRDSSTSQVLPSAARPSPANIVKKKTKTKETWKCMFTKPDHNILSLAKYSNINKTSFKSCLLMEYWLTIKHVFHGSFYPSFVKIIWGPSILIFLFIHIYILTKKKASFFFLMTSHKL